MPSEYAVKIISVNGNFVYNFQKQLVNFQIKTKSKMCLSESISKKFQLDKQFCVECKAKQFLKHLSLNIGNLPGVCLFISKTMSRLFWILISNEKVNIYETPQISPNVVNYMIFLPDISSSAPQNGCCPDMKD